MEDCPRFDADGNSAVSINELLRAGGNALYGCGVVPPTRVPTRTATGTATPAPSTPTPTASPTATATRTATFTATPTSSASVCGGTITSVPKLCDVEVVPNPVPLRGSFELHYCLSDREGDIVTACLAIQAVTAPPIPPTCQPLRPAAGLINGCFSSEPIRATDPAGEYVAVLYFEDEGNHRSDEAAAPFSIR